MCFHQNPQNNEEKIANCLIKEIDTCDILLDLHSTHCKKDVEFAFIDYPSENNKELLSLIQVKNALAGWPEIYDDNNDIDNFCTEKYAYVHGKTGITVECGYHKGQNSVEVARQSILNVLAYYGVIDISEPVRNHPNLVKMSSFITKKANGRLSRNYRHLSKIKKGEVLAIYDNGEQIISDFDGVIIIPNHNADIGSEWFYLGHL